MSHTVGVYITLGNWTSLAVVRELDGAEHLLLVRTNVGGMEELETFDLGLATRSTFDSLAYALEHLRIHAIEDEPPRSE